MASDLRTAAAGRRYVPAVTERRHRWAVVAVSVIDEDQAEALEGMDETTRRDLVCDIVASGEVEAVRGPMCTECVVGWGDVHAATTPWPCPGKRPPKLGGELLQPEQRLTRQQRRARQRDAVKAAQQDQLDTVKGIFGAAARQRKAEVDEIRKPPAEKGHPEDVTMTGPTRGVPESVVL